MASQLPEDAWLKLAREMVEKGDLRLAVRAMYLAMLAHLGLAGVDRNRAPQVEPRLPAGAEPPRPRPEI